jgi:mRNA-degrading endonuclease RelE of RelBE toxin-antitoxin system
MVPEIGEPAVREIIHGPYRIIYEIFPDRETIYVLRFWHGARGEPEIKPAV